MQHAGRSPRAASGLSVSVDRAAPGAGRHALVRVSGPLVFGGSQPLRTAVAACVQAEQPWLLVDLTDVSRMDRAGAVALVGMRRHLRAAGGCLHIFDRSGTAATALARSGLARVFPIDSSLAVAAARDGRPPGPPA